MSGQSPYVYFSDLNGDGIADLIRYSQTSGTVNVHLAPEQCHLTDLLSEVGMAVDENPEQSGFAAIVKYEYVPSSNYLNGILPFVVQTVSRETLRVLTPVKADTDIHSKA